MKPIHVLIAVEQPILCHGLRELLSAADGIQLVGEAKNTRDVLAQVNHLQPDVVILDISLAGQNGMEVARELKRQPSRPPRILILSAYDDKDYLVEALQAGVHAYLLKNTTCEVLVETVRQIHKGEKLLSPELITSMVEEFQSLSRERALEESGLSDTELQILEHVANGETYQEIADYLYLSKRTVQRKVQSAMSKMGADTRTEAVAKAIRSGLI